MRILNKMSNLKSYVIITILAPLVAICILSIFLQTFIVNYKNQIEHLDFTGDSFISTLRLVTLN